MFGPVNMNLQIVQFTPEMSLQWLPPQKRCGHGLSARNFGQHDILTQQKLCFLAVNLQISLLAQDFAGKPSASPSNQQCLSLCPTNDSLGMVTALVLILTMHGLSKKQTKVAMSSRRRRRGRDCKARKSPQTKPYGATASNLA